MSKRRGKRGVATSTVVYRSQLRRREDPRQCARCRNSGLRFSESRKWCPACQGRSS